jgi:hypothetical protein
VNDELSELKSRLRRVEEALATGAGSSDRVDLAQAVSHARRLARREDRTRPPSAAFRASVERAERVAGAKLAT